MVKHKYIIHISGASCSGKSTLSNMIAQRTAGTYLVSYDKMKWHLAGYHRDKDIPLIQEITLGLFEVVCKQGIPIQMDFGFPREEDYFRYKAIADAYGYRFVFVLLTCPEDILIERFRQRIESAKQNPASKISITNEDLYRENLKKKFFEPPDALAFDTSVSTTEEIYQAIEKVVSTI